MHNDSLPNKKTLGFSKLEAFADDRIRVAKMMMFVFGRVEIENFMGKGENAGNHAAFSPFPTMFSKDFFLRVIVS